MNQLQLQLLLQKLFLKIINSAERFPPYVSFPSFPFSTIERVKIYINDMIQSVKVSAIQAADWTGGESSSAASLDDGQSGVLALLGKYTVLTYRILSNFRSYKCPALILPQKYGITRSKSSLSSLSYFSLHYYCSQN